MNKLNRLFGLTLSEDSLDDAMSAADEAIDKKEEEEGIPTTNPDKQDPADEDTPSEEPPKEEPPADSGSDTSSSETSKEEPPADSGDGGGSLTDTSSDSGSGDDSIEGDSSESTEEDEEVVDTPETAAIKKVILLNQFLDLEEKAIKLAELLDQMDEEEIEEDFSYLLEKIDDIKINLKFTIEEKYKTADYKQLLILYNYFKIALLGIAEIVEKFSSDKQTS